MSDEDKTKAQLINELTKLRQRIAVLEAAETERKQVEAMMKKIDLRLQLALRSANIGLWDIDLRRNEYYISPEWKQQIGLEDQDVLDPRKEWENRLHPEEREHVLGTWAAYLAGEKPDFNIEFRLRHKDGSYRWILSSGEVLRDDEGNPARMTGCHIDITEHKQTREALRTSKTTLENIFRAVPLGIGLVRNRRLDWSNDRMHKLTGYSPEALSGASPQMFYESEEEYKRVGKILYKGMRERGIGEVETRWKHKDGTIFECLIRSTPLDRSNPPAGFISAVLDITERKKAEKEIRQRTAQLEALREVGLELTSQLDLDVLLRSIVARAVELLDADSAGFSIYRPELDLLEWSLAFDPELVSDGGLISWGEGLAGKVWETDQPLIVNDYKQWKGRLATFENYGFAAVVGVPVHWGDEFFGVLEVVARPPRTFTPANAELLSLLATQAAIAIRNARLYEEIKDLHWQTRLAAETKAILLDEVNHRAKNNLTAIIGLLLVEKRHAQEEKLAAHQAILEDMINRIQGLATVHNLLSASEWSPLPLSELTSRVIHSALQVLPSDKNVSVEVSPSPVRVASKLANSLALVINELATNTVKYALSKRHTACIIVYIALEGGNILFEFRDDGPGYPEEVLHLERHDVGLYLVQNIVREQLCGESTFHNNQGAVTTIRFPATAGN